MVGVVGDQLRRRQHQDIQDRPVVVASRLERFDFRWTDDAAIAGDRGGEGAQGLEPGVDHGAAFPDRRDHGVVNLGHLRQVGMSGHAVGAFVFIDDGEIGDVTLDGGETGLLGDAPERAVGFQRRRAFRQDAVKVRDKSPALLDLVEQGSGLRRRGRGVVEGEAVDGHDVMSFRGVEGFGRRDWHDRLFRHSPELRQLL